MAIFFYIFHNIYKVCSTRQVCACLSESCLFICTQNVTEQPRLTSWYTCILKSDPESRNTLSSWPFSATTLKKQEEEEEKEKEKNAQSTNMYNEEKAQLFFQTLLKFNYWS